MPGRKRKRPKKHIQAPKFKKFKSSVEPISEPPSDTGSESESDTDRRLEATSGSSSDSGLSDVDLSPATIHRLSIALPNMTEIKLILLGDSRVGKTSLAQRYLTGNFPDELPGTLGVKLDHYYCRHERKKKNVNLSLWDTAGFERFANCVPQNHYSNTDVALVVFDMSEERTLFSANIWKAELFNHLPTDVPTLLVGNKCDLPEARIHRTRKSAREVAKTFNGFIETSAKDNIMVEEVFEQAITLALNHNDCKPSKETITVNQPQQKKWCSSCTVI